MQEQPKTQRGHEEPFAVQFSIFLANRVGRLRELLALLARNEIRIAGLSVVDSTDWAVIRAVVSDPNKARETLQAEHLPFTESEVLLIEIDDADEMGQVCEHLLRAEINVHFVYPLVIRSHDRPVMVFHVDDWVLATHTLGRQGFVLLGSEDLADPA